MAKYTVHSVTTREEFDQAMDVVWTSFHDPYAPEFNLFHPVLGYTPAEHQASIQRDKDREWAAHAAAAPGSSHWLVARDSATGTAVGCVHWLIHRTNPFAGPDEVPAAADVWPEGEHRRFAAMFLAHFTWPRKAWMARPHITFKLMAVVPAHRRRGVAGLLMRWGVEQADALGLECWTEATPGMGAPVYERFGMRTVAPWAFVPPPAPEGCVMWNQLCHAFRQPCIAYMMWRPVGGRIEAGGPQAPWEIQSKT